MLLGLLQHSMFLLYENTTCIVSFVLFYTHSNEDKYPLLAAFTDNTSMSFESWIFKYDNNGKWAQQLTKAMNNTECIQSGPQLEWIDPAVWSSLSQASGNGGKIFSLKNRNSHTLISWFYGGRHRQQAVWLLASTRFPANRGKKTRKKQNLSPASF